ncbi:MAG: DUF5668 domain-containing protein [Candidatus Andersenbacteria bacterium]
MTIGLILIVIGLVFFARALGYFEEQALNIIWPLLLVVLGLSMLSHKMFGHECKGKKCWYCENVNWSGGKKR